MDEEAVYGQIGRFLLSFQSLESTLTDMSHLMLDPERDVRIRWVLEQLPTRRLLDVTGALIVQALGDWKIPDTHEFLDRVKKTWKGCDAVIQRRNALVHSDYDYLGPCSSDDLVAIVRTKLCVTRKTTEVDGESLTAGGLEEDLHDLAECLMQLGFIRTQLIHWLPPRLPGTGRAS
ncbi:MAG: hypothetical protein ABSA41_09205 [Terriglobia bacterium]|jgi:hypothetical protein